MPELMTRIRRRVRRTLQKRAASFVTSLGNRIVDKAKVDPRISFPSYKSFDEFIDVERLEALDGFVTEVIQKHLQTREDDKFHTGVLILNPQMSRLPGSKIIYLTRNKRQGPYTDLNQSEWWERTPDAAEFAPLMDFIDTLPFKDTARMMIMYDASGSPVTPHRDHMTPKTRHEFLWFRTNKSKPFYLLNHKTGVKKYVESYSAWFDTCNQFHGADGTGGLSFSIRVDGHFSDALRARIPQPEYNEASTASLWACVGDRH